MLCQGSEDRKTAPRVHVLRLLALLEHPDALHPELALRLGRQILVTLDAGARLRCEAVDAAGEAVAETSWSIVS